MIEAANAVDAITLPGQKPAARDDIAVGFSFAGAMSALKARAAQSLETFGATPQQTAPGKSPASTETSSRPAAQPQANTPQAQTGADVRTNDTPSQTQTAMKPAASAAQPAATAPQIQPAAAAAAGAAPIAAPPPQQTAPQPVRTESLSAAKADAAKAGAPKAPRAPQPTQPQPATQDFAKLLAKRLEGGATKFELRLDPPELGRVEAQLKVGDKGEAVLALKFENQTTLDLFARDAGALRDALFSSGFDLGGERLAFSLADDAAAPDAGVKGAAIAAVEIYEPVFLAPYSRGAVDLRV